MTSSVSPSQSRQIPFSALIGFSFIAQILSIPPLWLHQSVSADLAGRYSTRYALALVANILLLIFWAIMFIEHDKAAFWLRKLSFVQHIRVIVFSGVIVGILWL